MTRASHSTPSRKTSKAGPRRRAIPQRAETARVRRSPPVRLDTASHTNPAADEATILQQEFVDGIDRLTNVAIAQGTMSLSPASMMMGYLDWLVHLAASPGKQILLAEKGLRKVGRLADFAGRRLAAPETPPCIEPLPHDRRFAHPGWQRLPYCLMAQGFLLSQQWWHNATTGIRGVSKAHEQMVNFAARQLHDMLSPSNVPWLNPETIEATRREQGTNLARGVWNFADDMRRRVRGEPPAGTDSFKVGENMAVTPGKVVYRNHLMELIQYAPSTAKVRREPVLMLSAWMMKYYIMDLSPHNSMVKYLVDRGHTVFMISWRNPSDEDRDLTMEDYRTQGIMAALDVVSKIVPGEKIHAVGYCLGGILLTIAAATMARDHDDRLASITLFTTLTDFTEVGEMSVFMDESQIAFLEDQMWQRGYLDPRQASGGFQLLRSKDLIWSKMVREYVLGEREPVFDLMAWNADGTRMPYRQHAELMHRLYVGNELFQGTYTVNDRPIAISNIRVPIFAVAAERDHVAPWTSVHKLHLQSDSTELTFVLTKGGHNVGIINEPGHPGRAFWIRTTRDGDSIYDPETWRARAEKVEGSWWPAWQTWLSEHSDGEVPARKPGAIKAGHPPIEDAPGSYVMMT